MVLNASQGRTRLIFPETEASRCHYHPQVIVEETQAQFSNLLKVTEQQGQDVHPVAWLRSPHSHLLL